MPAFRYLRLITYGILLMIVWQYSRRSAAIPVDLASSNGNATSNLLQMGAGNVLSSLITADDVTAQVIWSDKAVYSPASSNIKIESAVIKVDPVAKARVLAMLSSSTEYDDDGQPCLCYFQPQLRLCWTAADQSSYCLLISGVSHGEIQSFHDGEKQGLVRNGRFIPAYIDIMERIFPGHRFIPMLKELEKERQKARANQALVPTATAVTPAADAPVAPTTAAAHL